MPELTALRALTLAPDGRTHFEKDADTIQATASTAKTVAAYTARQFFELDALITVTDADMFGGSSAQLQVGDVLTLEDALYGMMLPSGNDAATAVGRSIGAAILLDEAGRGGDGRARFAAEMVAQMSALGWVGHGFVEPTGAYAGNRCSARQMCELMHHIDATDPVLRDIMGTLTRTITITGPNARTIDLTHTINPDGAVKFPEFVAGKTGSGEIAGACVFILWDGDDGCYATGLMNGGGITRYADLRALMDHAIANPLRNRGASVAAFL